MEVVIKIALILLLIVTAGSYASLKEIELLERKLEILKEEMITPYQDILRDQNHEFGGADIYTFHDAYLRKKTGSKKWYARTKKRFKEDHKVMEYLRALKKYRKVDSRLEKEKMKCIKLYFKKR